MQSMRSTFLGVGIVRCIGIHRSYGWRLNALRCPA
jgi:hypothetical protein